LRQLLLTIGIMLTVAAILLLVIARSPRASKVIAEDSNTTAAEARSAASKGTSAPETGLDVLIPAQRAPSAPELAAGDWINSGALTIKGLRGRVVLVDFWTFGCYNCRNTLPALKRWDAAYRQSGLTIIGVHSPEFDEEKDLRNVRREVASLGIEYGVVTDNDYDSWRAYGIEAWPTVVILDKQGRIRWTHIGEGKYAEMENVIRQLLAE
jgi:thiol-disulfide isomerase/thioredoxin